eukprot:Hpha_TRINITY_DN18913_c0_g1::TRINITY_DN18913_c0_g1_i1::g.17423::m.17423
MQPRPGWDTSVPAPLIETAWAPQQGVRLSRFGRLLVEEVGLTVTEVEAVVRSGIESDAELLAFVGNGEHTNQLIHAPSARYKIERWYWALRRNGWEPGRLRPVAPVQQRRSAEVKQPNTRRGGAISELSPGDLPPGRGPARAISPTAPRRWEERFNPYARSSDTYGTHWRSQDQAKWTLATTDYPHHAKQRAAAQGNVRYDPAAVQWQGQLRGDNLPDQEEEISYRPPQDWTEYQPPERARALPIPPIDGQSRWGVRKDQPVPGFQTQPQVPQAPAPSPRRAVYIEGVSPVYAVSDTRAPAGQKPWQPV